MRGRGAGVKGNLELSWKFIRFGGATRPKGGFIFIFSSSTRSSDMNSTEALWQMGLNRFRGHLRAPLVLVIFLYSTHLASLLSIIMPNVKMSYQHTCPTCYLLRHERAFSSPITTMKISFFQTWYLPRHGPASFTLLHQLLPQHLPEVRSFFFSLTQGGRSWQPFGEGKNGHEDFCQARKCKFANSTQYNMQYIQCNSALLSQETLFLTQKRHFFAQRFPKSA